MIGKMDWSTRRKPFADAAIAAFPPDCEEIARQAESDLEMFVNDNYRTASKQIIVAGSSLYVPNRLHFADEILVKINDLSPGAQCLLTRATNGYIRQEAAKAVVGLNFAWSIPFVLLLLGEYVVEITDDIHGALDQLDRSVYTAFVLQNRPVMRTLRARATSYWGAYHRERYPQRHSHPALAALTRMEQWAS